MTGRLAKAAVFGRRHVWRLMFLLAYFGVPVAVMMATGGIHALGFWLLAFMWMAVVFLPTLLLLVILKLVVSPFGWALGFVVSERRMDAVKESLQTTGSWIAMVCVYVGSFPFEPSGIRLPTPWPGVGVVLVLGVAYHTSRLLIRFGEKLAPDTPRPVVPTPGPELLDHTEDEFWSDQMVEGWRGWRWDGVRLRGVFARWNTDTYLATCETCARVPGWDHRCGINAVKDVEGVYRFPRNADVVGKVEMWGDVIEHDFGYRASHARMTQLWTESGVLARKLEQAYPGVPVHVGRPIDRARRTDG